MSRTWDNPVLASKDWINGNEWRGEIKQFLPPPPTFPPATTCQNVAQPSVRSPVRAAKTDR